MRQDHEEIGCDGDHSARQIEVEEEGDQYGGEQGFCFGEDFAGETEGDDADRQDPDRIEKAQRPAGGRADDCVGQRAEGRLVIPEIAVEHLAVQELVCSGQMVVFVGPEQLGVAQAQDQRDEEERREELPGEAVWQAFIIRFGIDGA